MFIRKILINWQLFKDDSVGQRILDNDNEMFSRKLF